MAAIKACSRGLSACPLLCTQHKAKRARHLTYRGTARPALRTSCEDAAVPTQVCLSSVLACTTGLRQCPRCLVLQAAHEEQHHTRHHLVSRQASACRRSGQRCHMRAGRSGSCRPSAACILHAHPAFIACSADILRVCSLLWGCHCAHVPAWCVQEQCSSIAA